MTPQEKCVSLETARELKHAGFPQDMERYWETSFSAASLHLASEVAESYYLVPKPNMCTTGDCKPIFAAPDAQEIAELLPWYIQEHCVFVGQRMEWRNPNNYTVVYGTLKDIFHSVSADSEVEARASMWLYLKESKLI